MITTIFKPCLGGWRGSTADEEIYLNVIENVTPKYKLALSHVFRDYFVLTTCFVAMLLSSPSSFLRGYSHDSGMSSVPEMKFVLHSHDKIDRAG